MKFFFIVLIVFSFITKNLNAEVKKYEIGVLSVDLKEYTKNRWQETSNYLTKTIDNAEFNVIPMTYDELNMAIKNKTIDFVLTNSAHYIIHEQRYNLFRLATVIYRKKGHKISAFGGVIVSLANRDDIKTLNDIEGKKIAAVKRGSLGGYQSQLKEMLDKEIPLPINENVIFTDMPHKKTLNLLFEKKVDVAFLRTGVIEHLIEEKELDLNKIKIINKKSIDYPFLLSTELYPEWPFSALEHIDIETKKRVAKALFNMKGTEKAAIDGKYEEWYIPLDYNRVTELLRSLRLPPFDGNPIFTLQDIINKYFSYIVGFIVISIILTIWLIVINIKLLYGKKQLTFLLNNDTLTKLPNRYALNEKLNSIINEYGNNREFALLLIDLDNFKDINNSYGHTIGDEILCSVADRLKNISNQIELFRIGGDEYAIIIKNITDKEIVTQIANNILSVINKPITILNTNTIKLKSSIGISFYPINGKTHIELLQNTDAALYLAKENGKGVVKYYSNELTSLAIKRVELEYKLQDAISNNQLELYYQPKFDVQSENIIGAEALIRWFKEDNSIVNPNDFIPLAERLGLINIINEFVITQAFKQIKEWLDRDIVPHNFKLAINISAQDLHNMNFLPLVNNLLQKYSVNPKNIEIEITESSFINKQDDTMEILKAIQKMNFTLALDDFGTGYSSLSYLKRMPINVIKIDKSFIDHITIEKYDQQIVNSIIQIGNIFGYKIVAEGIETKEQLNYLKIHKCDMYQGYFGSKPISVNDFEQLLKQE